MRQQQHHIVDILFVLALFGVFTVCILALVTMGADVYRNTVRSSEENYESRTASAYLVQKIRQNDTEGAVQVGQLENTDAIILSQTIEGKEYLTYLYYNNGFLKELLVQKGTNLVGNPLEAGQNIMPLKDMSVENSFSRILSINLTLNSGEVKKLLVSLHCP